MPCGSYTGKMSRRYVVDLFSCEGGAAVGYEAAEFSLLGVEKDPERSRNYPFQCETADFRAGLDHWLERHGDDVAFIHASPPCQTFSTATPDYARARYLDLMQPTRELLEGTGKPWVIENIPRAFRALGWEPTATLNGEMFPDLWCDWDFWGQSATLKPYKGRINPGTGKPYTQQEAVEEITGPDGNYLPGEGKEKSRGYNRRPRVMVAGQRWGVLRPRAFLASFPISEPSERRAPVYIVSVTTSPNNTCTWNQLNRTTLTPRSAAAIMAGQKFKGKLDHMSMKGAGESIPPEYTLHIARCYEESLGCVRPREPCWY